MGEVPRVDQALRGERAQESVLREAALHRRPSCPLSEDRGPWVHVQEERDPPHPFCELTVSTEVTDGLATQSRGLVCATEKSFAMQLVEGVRRFIRAGLEDGKLCRPYQAVNLCQIFICAEWEDN